MESTEESEIEYDQRRTMLLKHYVHLTIYSTALTADQIAARLGVDADDSLVMGSQRSAPAIPKANAWTLYSSRDNPDLSEQIVDLLDRIGAIEQQVGDLVSDLGDREASGVVLSIVRKYDLPRGWNPSVEPTAGGWGITERHVRLLGRIGALIEVDEYFD